MEMSDHEEIDKYLVDEMFPFFKKVWKQKNCYRRWDYHWTASIQGEYDEFDLYASLFLEEDGDMYLNFTIEEWINPHSRKEHGLIQHTDTDIYVTLEDQYEDVPRIDELCARVMFEACYRNEMFKEWYGSKKGAGYNQLNRILSIMKDVQFRTSEEGDPRVRKRGFTV